MFRSVTVTLLLTGTITGFLGLAQGQMSNGTWCNEGPTAVSDVLPFFPELSGGKAPQTCISTPGLMDERCFYTYVPDCATNRTVPLVLDIHAIQSCPVYSVFYTGWMELSTSECFIVVMPLGVTDLSIVDRRCYQFSGGIPLTTEENSASSLDCCCEKDDTDVRSPVPEEDIQDALFLRRVILSVVESFQTNENDGTSSTSGVDVDTTRIYLTGHSNGCIASLALAATSSDIVAGVACMAGSLIAPFDAIDYTPVPIWMVHGLLDETIPYNGSDTYFITDKGKEVGFLPIPFAMNYIAEKNGCGSDPDQIDFDEGSTHVFTNCTGQSSVEWVVLDNSDHSPYLGASDVSEEESKITTIDTTGLAWNFLKTKQKDGIPSVFQTGDPTKPPSSAGTKYVYRFVEALSIVLAVGLLAY